MLAGFLFASLSSLGGVGIGMTCEGLETNLGTIAHSGSLEFKTENAALSVFG